MKHIIRDGKRNELHYDNPNDYECNPSPHAIKMYNTEDGIVLSIRVLRTQNQHYAHC